MKNLLCKIAGLMKCCVVLLLFSTTASGAAPLDPTTPSPKLLERIHPKTATVSETGPEDSQHGKMFRKLRLKAIVLGDADNGTALVSLDDKKTFVVRVRRSNGTTVPTQVRIGGTLITVRTFTAKSITFTHPDSKEQFTIR